MLKAIMIVLTFMASFASSPSRAQMVSSIDPNSQYLVSFSPYAEAMMAHSQYAESITQARLNWARARYHHALAEGHYEIADMISEFGDRLRLDMKLLRKDHMEQRRKLKVIERHSRNIAVFRTGRTSSAVFAGLNYFFMHVVDTQVLVKEMAKIAEDIDTLHFRANTKTSLKSIKKFEGKTVGDLFHFIEENNYSFQRFSTAHLICLQAIDAFVQAGEDELEKIHTHMKKLRENTLDIWSPPNLDPVEAPDLQNFNNNGGWQ